MGRPSKLTPEQWADVDRRLAAGESGSELAREYGVSPAAMSRRGVTQKSQVVRNVAQKLADAQTALAELPLPQQYTAMTLAAKLRNISDNLASAAELGAKTSHRLQALANTVMQKVDDADPMLSKDHLQGVAVLTKMANDAAATPLNLLAANKGAIKPDADDVPKGLEHFYGGN